MTKRNTADRAWTAGHAALILMALLVSACSSSPPASASAHVPAPASENACQQVSAVLSDGPDPDADPVVYAEAQILPLRRISVSSPALRDAIGQLADAYQQFFASNGKSSNAKEAVVVASRKLDSICPGAAS